MAPFRIQGERGRHLRSHVEIRRDTAADRRTRAIQQWQQAKGERGAAGGSFSKVGQSIRALTLTSETAP